MALSQVKKYTNDPAFIPIWGDPANAAFSWLISVVAGDDLAVAGLAVPGGVSAGSSVGSVLASGDGVASAVEAGDSRVFCTSAG